MALALVKEISPSTSFALWHIDENLSDLCSMYPFAEGERIAYEAYKADSRKAEWLAARLALRVLMKENGLEGRAIIKDEFGKPHIAYSTAHISISHTRHRGAAALSTKAPVGIDIELPGMQIQRVARKFLHASEAWARADVGKLTQVWCAKEALYKLHGRTQLAFAEQLRVQEPLGEFPENGQIHENGLVSNYQLFYTQKGDLCLCIAHSGITNVEC